MSSRSDNQQDGHQKEESERARKACCMLMTNGAFLENAVACRKQKMKCMPAKPDDGPSCRRCRRMQLPCVYRPRANAASLQDVQLPSLSSAAQGVQDVGFVQTLIHRVERIEKHLRLPSEDLNATSHSTDSTSPVGPNHSLAPVLAASVHLKRKAAGVPNANAWNAGIVEQLWKSYDALDRKLISFADHQQIPRRNARPAFPSAKAGVYCTNAPAPCVHAILLRESWPCLRSTVCSNVPFKPLP
ncbi:hypothetical protein D0860_03697 [Hortaea werneckii]|uniref:Zn(2)-C6 fungal-type domain-containing protein n=1 Tax=Hortaea werneckii TaxID=91943 RepID=A0A3M7J2S2_HORWE|nr:hypothetical protein D0860_03697 [Hortaea werneckii]RMZ32085.1 hypothetical protein D0859_03803 [Hortaea werneckii]